MPDFQIFPKLNNLLILKETLCLLPPSLSAALPLGLSASL